MRKLNLWDQPASNLPEFMIQIGQIPAWPPLSFNLPEMITGSSPTQLVLVMRLIKPKAPSVHHLYPHEAAVKSY